ncbi:MAG: hypothetical protein WBD29_01415, partial [Candidatus Competibacter sp.]
LQTIPRGAGNEIQLTDGIAALLNEEQVLAYEFSGRRHDCGSKLGYLVATVEYGARHPELGEQFQAYLRANSYRLNKSEPAEDRALAYSESRLLGSLDQ